MKDSGKGKGASLSSVKGMCSYKSNPMPKAKETQPSLGAGMNKDRARVNKMIMEQQSKEKSRGTSGI